MKETYLDIMEKALSAYDSKRIRDYIDAVKKDRLSEHGFPRLGANIGILMAHGRRLDLTDTFVEIMDICCDTIPKMGIEIPARAANDFSVREICWCLAEVEKAQLLPQSKVKGWKNSFLRFDPWKGYERVAPTPDTPVNNWAAFAALSEFVRGKYLGIDTTEFVNWEVASQVLSFDENGMYKDPNNPILYDYMTRVLLSALLHLGYEGKLAAAIADQLDKCAELSLKMQSTTGEIAFGGRSNQCVFNESVLSSYYEMEAARFAKKGEPEIAGRFKAAAISAAQTALSYLELSPISHVKNRYDPNSMIGCESYAYFDKYMITTASNAYIAYLFADDSIQPTAAEESYVIHTSDAFHKVFMAAGGYHLEFDTNADLHYDANGLGRVHKKGCPSAICLSVPFPAQPAYRLEQKNPGPMSLCSAGSADAPYTLTEHTVGDTVRATFACAGGTERYTVSADGVDIAYSRRGFMLPVFEFDGSSETKVELSQNAISIAYRGAVCTYRFDGTLMESAHYCNRNGRYRVYRVDGEHLHIEIRGNDDEI